MITVTLNIDEHSLGIMRAAKQKTEFLSGCVGSTPILATVMMRIIAKIDEGQREISLIKE